MDCRHFVATLAAVPLGAARLAFGRGQTTAARPRPALQELLADYVAVADGGAPLTYLKAGRIVLDAGAAFDEHSVCRIYSMTKSVTGLSAMLLVEAGKLRLEQPVGDLIPELRKPQVAIDPSKGLEARPATQTMTIRHLLTHTAGLAYWTPLHDTDALSAAYRVRGITPGNYGAGLTRPGYGPQAVGLDDMVRRIAEVPLAAEPGRVWRYSVGLDVMGLVIQRVSGKPLDVFARERLFEPLKMASTGFRYRRPPCRGSRPTTRSRPTASCPSTRERRASS